MIWIKGGKLKTSSLNKRSNYLAFLRLKVKKTNFGNFYLSLCPDWNFVTNHNHHYNGRIIIAWRPHVFSVNLLHLTDQFIHTEILVNATKLKFLCTFVYGHNDVKKKESLWNFLCDTATNLSLPWCVGGDFNAIMHYDDRIGSIVREKEILPMAQCMHQCRLHDIKSTGRFYTWNNKQEGSKRAFSKID